VRTRETTPQALLSWLKADVEWGTTEDDFKQYPVTLSDKVGAEFTYSTILTPKIGDVIFQGDGFATITGFNSGKIVVDDGAELAEGLAVGLRSRCSVGLHLVDTSDDIWYWNRVSGDWELGDETTWNTIWQINRHIEDLDIASFGKGIRFDVNLKTSDDRYTPYVRELKLLGLFDIEFLEDIIYESVIPTIEQALEVTAQINIQLQADTDQINFADTYKLENEGYNFTDYEIVYDISTDPTRTKNIATAYTKGTPREGGGFDPGVLQLDGVKPAGSIIEIKLRYFPEIAVNTKEDFYEVNRTPSLVFERIRKEDQGQDGARQLDFVKDKLTLSGVRLKSPAMDNIIFEYAVFTSSPTDQKRLGEALHRFFRKNKYITSRGLDIPYSISSKDTFSSINKANVSDVQTHTGSFTVHRVLSYLGEPEDVSLVGNFQRSMTTN